MINAAAFVIGFVLIGIAVVLIAMRGGSRGAGGASQGQSRGARTASSLAIAVICLAFGIAIPVAVAVSNSDADQDAPGGVRLTAQQAHGRVLFARNCGTCHTLKSAGTTGRVGPNLDQLRPPKALVLNAIKFGRARGQGQMPAMLLVGDEAEAVASFVAATAGR